ncbi:VQ motif-containing protein 18-like [Andrographis paniculata]|uniref:VQ motif-containing protein 18-like n=1 Tax=Andrographis paniculata TaxID=175694 RepID=UPI0021E841CA|nr:VQ motif-containing protein 18-like [Andrographis paniculata]
MEGGIETQGVMRKKQGMIRGPNAAAAAGVAHVALHKKSSSHAGISKGAAAAAAKPKIRIIHIFAPEIIKTDAANFRELVQRLTGKPSATDADDDRRRKLRRRTRRRERERERGSWIIKGEDDESEEIWSSGGSASATNWGGGAGGFLEEFEYSYCGEGDKGGLFMHHNQHDDQLLLLHNNNNNNIMNNYNQYYFPYHVLDLQEPTITNCSTAPSPSASASAFVHPLPLPLPLHMDRAAGLDDACPHLA